MIHCTLGDGLIAIATLALSLLIAGTVAWPRQRLLRVGAVALALGLAYTAYSEYLNVYVRQSWAYTDAMPTVQVFGIRLGVTPLLQWIAVPAAALWILARRLRAGAA